MGSKAQGANNYAWPYPFASTLQGICTRAFLSFWIALKSFMKFIEDCLSYFEPTENWSGLWFASSNNYRNHQKDFKAFAQNSENC